MFIIRLSLVLITVLCISHFAHSQEFVLYGTAGEGTCNTFPAGERSLYIVNPNTGQMQFVGTPGFDGITALAQLDDGRLLATGIQDDDTSILIEIDPSTGQGTLIGVIGDRNNPGECSRVPGLTYDSATNTLYGLARRCNDGSEPLVTITPDTAEMTIIGDTELDGGGFGLAIRSDGTLFASAWMNTNFMLYTLDRITGNPTLVGTMDTASVVPNGLAVGGLAFHPVTQQLFASTNNGDVGNDSYLLTVDESAPPSFNVQGQTENCFDGLVFVEGSLRNVPTISQWGLIAMAGLLGIVGFMVMRRKKVTA